MEGGTKTFLLSDPAGGWYLGIGSKKIDGHSFPIAVLKDRMKGVRLEILQEDSGTKSLKTSDKRIHRVASMKNVVDTWPTYFRVESGRGAGLMLTVTPEGELKFSASGDYPDSWQKFIVLHQDETKGDQKANRHHILNSSGTVSLLTSHGFFLRAPCIVYSRAFQRSCDCNHFSFSRRAFFPSLRTISNRFSATAECLKSKFSNLCSKHAPASKSMPMPRRGGLLRSLWLMYGFLTVWVVLILLALGTYVHSEAASSSILFRELRQPPLPHPSKASISHLKGRIRNPRETIFSNLVDPPRAELQEARDRLIRLEKVVDVQAQKLEKMINEKLQKEHYFRHRIDELEKVIQSIQSTQTGFAQTRLTFAELGSRVRDMEDQLKKIERRSEEGKLSVEPKTEKPESSASDDPSIRKVVVDAMNRVQRASEKAASQMKKQVKELGRHMKKESERLVKLLKDAKKTSKWFEHTARRIKKDKNFPNDSYKNKYQSMFRKLEERFNELEDAFKL